MSEFDLSPVSAAETMIFAELSGDRNPIHVDPLAARRLLYGQTVVHGVHTVMRALDRAVGGEECSGPPAQIKARFIAPLFEDVAAEAALEATTSGKQRIRVGHNLRKLAIIEFNGSPNPPPRRGSGMDSRASACEVPEQLETDDYTSAEGQVELSLEPGRHARLFPHLAREPAWDELAAVLLGITYIVGMKCPGMDSLLASIDLKCATEDKPAPSMDYRVKRHDPRFGIVVIELRAGRWTGEATAFVRPAPAKQPSFSAVKKRVDDGTYTECQALVIGGSRGLGEVAAKIICAGGGRAIVTYRDGHADALRVCEEITRGGGQAEMLRLDVTDPAISDIASIELRSLTDLLYFASPRIDANPGESFDQDLFEHYLKFYVEPLEPLLALLDGRLAEIVRLFWPSSEYIDAPAKGFEEYAAAKKAGEAACLTLTHARPGLFVEMPRLPRMRTDQTSSVVTSVTEEPLDFLLGALAVREGARING